MEFAISIAPILLLIVLMTMKNGLPSHIALPLTALVIYAIQLLVFEADPNRTNATVVAGLLAAWTPILIIWGAIFMFRTMERSGSMDLIRRWLNGISDNSVAQLMVIGWAFAFMIEGASGFGTPAALAAPILVGMGFEPLRVAVLCLIMNTVPVSFGAVGTPTWFGMGQLGLSEAAMLSISADSAIIHAVAALLIPPIALLFVVDRREVLRNAGFVFLSIAACVVPYALLARINYEFPALLGGAVGFLTTIVAAKLGIGLASAAKRPTQEAPIGYVALIRATFPLWGTVLVLLVTRIPQLGIKSLLTDPTPAVQLTLGSFADLTVSRSAVITLDRIFGTDASWVFETLYVPAFIPFFLISLLAFAVFRMPGKAAGELFSETYRQMSHAIIALLAALVMVKLMMMNGERSIVMIIGNNFAEAAGERWEYFAAFLGALGSFFSGSATISNLTFGGIQDSIAVTLELDRTVILAMQSVGAALGNMVCINNIVAVCSILGITRREGYILKKTVGPMLLYGIIAAIVGQLL